MSNIRVNTTELMQMLERTPAHHKLMLVGRHGIGKSEILTEFYSRQGIPVVPLFLGQMADPCAFQTPLLWVLESAEAYREHEGRMRKYGRVCTIQLK